MRLSRASVRIREGDGEGEGQGWEILDPSKSVFVQVLFQVFFLCYLTPSIDCPGQGAGRKMVAEVQDVAVHRRGEERKEGRPLSSYLCRSSHIGYTRFYDLIVIPNCVAQLEVFDIEYPNPEVKLRWRGNQMMVKWIKLNNYQ
jgi:hypothetical protein